MSFIAELAVIGAVSVVVSAALTALTLSVLARVYPKGRRW